MHSHFLFNCFRTVSLTHLQKNVHANQRHGNMIFADIARVDLIFLNIQLITNKPIKQLQIFWATITEKKTYMRYSLSSKERYLF